MDRWKERCVVARRDKAIEAENVRMRQSETDL